MTPDLTDLDTTILNKALEFALAWGPDWLQPTQARMKALYSDLTDVELDRIDAVAREAMLAGHDYLYDHSECTVEECKGVLRQRFVWVSDENVTRIYSQGQYYAQK